MKKIGLIIGAVAFLSIGSLSAQVTHSEKIGTAVHSVQSTQPITQLSKSKLEFAVTTHDFGNIVQGDKVAYTFEFKNSGEEPLILSNVLTTCGCTATNWPRNPIPPGGSSEISATFNSAGKSGKQNKVITVISNAANGNQRVSIISNVTPKPAPVPSTVTPTKAVTK